MTAGDGARFHDNHTIPLAADNVLAWNERHFGRRTNEPALARLVVRGRRRDGLLLPLKCIAESVHGANQPGLPPMIRDDVPDLEDERRQTALGDVGPGPEVLPDFAPWTRLVGRQPMSSAIRSKAFGEKMNFPVCRPRAGGCRNRRSGRETAGARRLLLVCSPTGLSMDGQFSRAPCTMRPLAPRHSAAYPEA